jgi:glycosyltransferase 2 family protein
MSESAQPGAPEQTKLERAGDIAARIGSLQPADPRVRRGVHAGIAIIVVLSIGLAAFTAAGDLPDVDWRFRPLALTLAVLAIATSLLANAGIWRRILRALGPELPQRRARAIWFTSGLGRYVPTSLLLPMMRVAMAEREGAPKRISLASIAYEMSLFFTAALILGAYFVIDLPELQDDPGRFLVIVLPVLAVFALQPRIFHNLADRALRRLGRATLPLSLPGPRVLEFVGLYAITYVVAGLGLFALASCVYPVGADDLVTVVGAFAVGTALSILAFVLPGGLVAREAGIALALSPVMPAAPAVAVAVLVRIVQLGLEVLLATVTPLLARRVEGSKGAAATSPP